MKKNILVLLNLCALLGVVAVASAPCRATDDVLSAKRRIEAFEPSQVALLPSPFWEAQQKNSEYLLSVDYERLLARIKANSGVPTDAKTYGGWENMSIAGHSLGHYLSAVSKNYAATGVVKFKEISDRIVKELDECQKNAPDASFAGDENFRKAMAEVSRGDIRSQGFDLNGMWVPWYVTHKIFAGLLDAYRYCDNAEALEVAKRLADWGIEITKDLDLDQFQKMLRCEYGGMNEAYYNLYAATGDEKYLRQGDRFYDFAVLKPLAEGRDELQGRHANTQIPKIIGLARRAELIDNDDNPAGATAKYFWDRVVHYHTYAIGGNSSGEHFGAPGVISSRLSDSTCETCNTYNMLKLTSKLYQQTGNVEYYDYFERALYNHILASINRDMSQPDELYTYYVPTTPGGFRTYSNRFDTWTCCHGTGMENHTQYGGEIFFRETLDDGSDVLYMNLAIPSSLLWEEKNVIVTLTPNGKFYVDAKEDLALTIKLRVPNNCVVKDLPTEGRYVLLGNHWAKGRTAINVKIVPEWKFEPTPDAPNIGAFFCGPVLYAGNIGPKSAKIANLDEEKSDDSVVIPVLVADDRNVDALVPQQDSEAPLNFFALPRSAKLDVGYPHPVSVVPFYDAKERYLVYFNRFTKDEWKTRQEEFEKARERQRRLQEKTLTFFQPGEMQAERDVNFQSENSSTGTHMGRKWRDARNGGWFEFDMKVAPNAKNALIITYWGDETGNRNFDILVDGQKIAERKLNQDKPGKFFDEIYPLSETTKDTIRVRFQGKPGAMAGGIFGARTVPADFADEAASNAN